MDATELHDLITRVTRDLGCAELALRCACENLEVVYVEARDDGLVVTDRGETFGYLETFDDPAFARLTVDQATAICRAHGVELDTSDREAYPEVHRAVSDAEPVRDVVDVVSTAVDALFAAARTDVGGY
jgi:hypothetical protein